MTRRLVLVLALALLTGACGPERPFELGVKEVPSDLLLGRQTKPTTPLPTLLPPTVFFTDPVAPPPAATPTTLPPPVPDPPPPPPPCPTADPLQPARLPATTDVARPPVPATYQYRTAGFIVGPSSRALPSTATHTISDVVPLAPGEFTFDVEVEADDEATTFTRYHIVPRTSTVQPPGLYIQAIDGRPFAPELLIVPFPALRGTTFVGAGAAGATSLSYNGTVEETERIDACGTNIDAIRVRLVGRATTSETAGGTFLAEEFDVTYVIATQYGGLIVRHALKASMPGSVDLMARELSGIISREPEEPR